MYGSRLCGSERDDFRPKRRSRALPWLTDPESESDVVWIWPAGKSYRKRKWVFQSSGEASHSEQLVAFSAFRFGNSACIPIDLEIGSNEM